MARKAKIASGILNIRLHPHSEAIYSGFIRDLYSLKRATQLHGDRFGMISMLDRSEEDDGIIFGTITTFTVIDTRGSWFDDRDMKEATKAQVSEISIPRNLHPNSAAFYFQFDVARHRVYFQTYSKGKVLSVNSALTFFAKLSSDLKILEKYGEAKINVVQSSVGLAKLFSLRVINELKITLQKPNADIFSDDFEEKIEAHLEAAHSKKMVITYEADKGSSVVPTDEIKAVSNAALEDGSVQVKGRDETGAVSLSTTQFPKILQDRYDPETMTEAQAFKSILPNPAQEQNG